MQNLVEIGRSAAELMLIFDFQNWRPSAILDFKIFAFLSKIEINAYFYLDVQHFMNIRRLICKMAAVRHPRFGMTS